MQRRGIDLSSFERPHCDHAHCPTSSPHRRGAAGSVVDIWNKNARRILHPHTERASCLHFMARSRRQCSALPVASTLTAFASPRDGT